MSKRQAKRAIEALKRERASLALDANLFDLGLADYPHAANSSARRKEIEAEIVALGGQVPESFAARRLREQAAQRAESKLLQSDTLIDERDPIAETSDMMTLDTQQERGSQVALFKETTQ